MRHKHQTVLSLDLKPQVFLTSCEGGGGDGGEGGSLMSPFKPQQRNLDNIKFEFSTFLCPAATDEQVDVGRDDWSLDGRKGRKGRKEAGKERSVGVMFQRLKVIYSKLQIYTHTQNCTENKYVHAQGF